MRTSTHLQRTLSRLGALGLLLLSLTARAISITSQPSNQSINPGDSVTLGVAVDSSDCVTTTPARAPGSNRPPMKNPNRTN